MQMSITPSPPKKKQKKEEKKEKKQKATIKQTNKQIRTIKKETLHFSWCICVFFCLLTCLFLFI